MFDEPGSAGDVTLTGWFIHPVGQGPVNFVVLYLTGAGVVYQFASSANTSWSSKLQLGSFSGGPWAYIQGQVTQDEGGNLLFTSVTTVFQGSKQLYP